MKLPRVMVTTQIMCEVRWLHHGHAGLSKATFQAVSVSFRCPSSQCEEMAALKSTLEKLVTEVDEPKMKVISSEVPIAGK